MATEQEYWFPAKRYGWGWGLPVTWQGWLTCALWLCVLIASGLAFMPRSPASFLLAAAIDTAALMLVCYLKGAPLGWRWGDNEDAP